MRYLLPLATEEEIINQQQIATPIYQTSYHRSCKGIGRGDSRGFRNPLEIFSIELLS